jgi:hypothetical protein
MRSQQFSCRSQLAEIPRCDRSNVPPGRDIWVKNLHESLVTIVITTTIIPAIEPTVYPKQADWPASETCNSECGCGLCSHGRESTIRLSRWVFSAVNRRY